ncbi:hypothetical protein MPER_09516 [Moniliophthora perniciosa FA553]|nr:hypothetical protein MPER_09516 [Moniliophthora perniciosa FA553]
MDSWSTTQRVLRSADSFHEHFAKSRPALTFPQLLYAFNSSVTRRNVGQIVDHHADKILGALTELSKRLEAVENENRCARGCHSAFWIEALDSLRKCSACIKLSFTRSRSP